GSSRWSRRRWTEPTQPFPHSDGASSMTPNANRRDFLKAGAVATATAAAANLIPTAVHAAGNDAIKVGLIGCGGRGTGALGNILEADKAVRVHAVGDVFPEKAKAIAGRFKKYGDRIQLGDRVFDGLDAY